MKQSLKFSHSDALSYRKITNVASGETNWRTLKCGQSHSDNESRTLFCGGPILAMEWATLPTTYENDEILAISVNTNPSEPILVQGNSVPVGSVIQFWSIPSTLSTIDNVPEMLYAINCPDGPVMSMKFCPSGGNIEGKRLGLLAIGTVDGAIDILALPPTDTIREERNDSKQFKLIEKSPVLSLRLSIRNECSKQITQISWSKVS